MEFEIKIKELGERAKKIKGDLKTEEAAKTSLIMPFFQTLGYDIFNPAEFTPEFIADIGIKKGEKVDYAIRLNGEVSILIEAKAITETLDKHDGQLFRYFGTTKAKFAILTNGIVYKFYTDLEKPNVMDNTPFLEINIENLKTNDIQQLQKFKKENYDTESILSTASDLKYVGLIKKIFKEELDNPSGELVRLILNKGVYDGIKNNKIVERFSPLIKKAFNLYINETVNNKLQSAINNTANDNELKEDENEDDGIVTTDEEIQAFYIIKAILSEFVNPKDITYKDTVRYFAVLYENKTTQWICRLYLKETVSYITIPDENKKEIRYDLKSLNDIYKLRKELATALGKYEKVK